MGTILSISGILIGLTFGIYGVWNSRRQKKRVELEFKNKECYSLFREDVNRLNIDVNYNNSPLSNSLILLKATLLNSGGVDIDNNRIHSSFKLLASSDYNWLEASITSSADGSITSINVDSIDKLRIEWDLLKKGESIEIEALAEVVNEKNSNPQEATDFYDNLGFDYRITDLNEVKKNRLNAVGERKKKRKETIFTAFMIAVVLAGASVLFSLLVSDQRIIPHNHSIQYEISGKENSYRGRILSSWENRVEVEVDGSQKVLDLTIDEFNKKFEITGIKKAYVDSGSKWINIIFAALYLFMGIAYFIVKFRNWRLQKQKELLNDSIRDYRSKITSS